MRKGLEYKNRKGVQYLLCKTDRAGKIRYVMARTIRGEPVDSLPVGFEIFEDVNGLVSVRKAQGSPIFAAEVQAVVVEIGRHKRLLGYRADARGKYVVVYGPVGIDPTATGGFADVARLDSRINHAHLEPVFRFELMNPVTRTFEAQRLCYLGSADDWVSLHETGPLPTLCGQFLGHLGKASMFDLR